MIRIGQFSTPQNSSLLLASRIGLHLRNQKSEPLLALQKRFCSDAMPGIRTTFTESLLLLFALNKISFDLETDRVVFNENS
jgi:hypothetical protein